MSRPRHELETLAGHILDQGDVDWSTLSPRTRLEDARTVDGLRLLEDLVRGFRHTQVAGEARGESTSGAALFRFAGLEARALVGRGSHGEVYRAYDPLLDQEVALKLRHAQSDTLAHQFIAEARRLVRVRHSNVVSVYGAALEGGRVGLWMEYVRGETLAARMAAGPLTADEVLAIGAELAAALAAVHRHGLVHGDLKAENVLCEAGGRIVLADFGAARDTHASGSGGVVSGTLQYLAPEVLLGASPTPASDLYALGVLLYRLLAAHFPYAGESYEALLAAHEQRRFVPLRERAPHVPRAVAAAIERCLDPDPQRRPRSAQAFARSLEAAVRPRQGVALATALLAVGVAALVALALWPRPPLSPWEPSVALRRDGSATPLASGAPVRDGDRLQLDFSAGAPTWLYVLDDDGSGRAAVLFPVRNGATPNPLAAQRWTLPSDGARELAWTIGGDAVREELLIVASRTPQPALERLIAGWQQTELPEAHPRGATRLSPAPLLEVRSAELRAALEAAQQQAGPGDLRSWRYVLPHAP